MRAEPPPSPCSQFTRCVASCSSNSPARAAPQLCWPPQADEVSRSRTDRPVSTWRESFEFGGWLEQRLATDRKELVARLQEQVDRHLQEHQTKVLGELRAGFDISFAAADVSGAARDAALRPPVVSAPPAPNDSADIEGRLQHGARPAASSSKPVLAVAPGPAAETPDKRTESTARERSESRDVSVDPPIAHGRRESRDVSADARLQKPSDDRLSLQSDLNHRLGSHSGCGCVPGCGPGFGSGFGSSSGTTYGERDSYSMRNSVEGEGSGSDLTSGRRTRSSIRAVHRRKHEGQQDQLGCSRFTSVRGLVSSSQFELVCSTLIVLNVLIMAAEVQVAGCQVGYVIGHPDCPSSTKDAWANASKGFLVASAVFNGLFFVELVLRVVALGRAALWSGWLWFDASLIVVGSLDFVQGMGGSLDININPSIMRTARIARIVRMIRFLKPHEGFSSLFLITRSIYSSRHSLCWSTLILMIMVSVVGMMVNQMVFLSLEDSSMSEAHRRELFDYWGTYSRMVVTMFEITLGNWAPPCRILMVRISPWWGLFITVYRCVFCYSIVSVIGAVFITETSRTASSDDEVAMIRKEREHKAHVHKLLEVFDDLDESGDGIVTWDEFQEVLNDPHMKRYLATMELEVTDLEGLFRLLDDGNGEIEAENFVNGIITLRGQAKNIDLLTLMKVTRKMSTVLDRLERGLLPESPPRKDSRRSFSITSQS